MRHTHTHTQHATHTNKCNIHNIRNMHTTRSMHSTHLSAARKVEDPPMDAPFSPRPFWRFISGPPHGLHEGPTIGERASGEGRRGAQGITSTTQPQRGGRNAPRTWGERVDARKPGPYIGAGPYIQGPIYRAPIIPFVSVVSLENATSHKLFRPASWAWCAPRRPWLRLLFISGPYEGHAYL